MSMSRGLVLQGGGARGAFECGVIKHLYEVDPNFCIDAVAGTSIGAINAVCLVGGRSREELGLEADSRRRTPPDETAPWAVETLWEKLKLQAPSWVPSALQPYLSRWCHPAFYWPRTDYLSLSSWTSCYDTSPLLGLLRELVDFDRLNRSPVRLTLVALDIESGQAVEFCNFGGGRIEPEHVLASGSLPPGFPMTKIGYHSYWDGGLFDNTPLESVIDALTSGSAERDWVPGKTGGNGEPADQLLIHVVQLMPSAGDVPRNLLEVQERMMQIIFSNKLQEDTERAVQVSEYVQMLRRIVCELPAKQAEAIVADRLFQKLVQRRPVKLVRIEMRSSGIASGGADFSPDTIDARISQGMNAAAQATGRSL